MMRSLSSAVAGLRSHQTKMDVIGNNISNVNTYGFKASRTTFSDVYYQNLRGSKAGSSNTSAGKNPTQIGYGAAVATIDVMNTVTGAATTDRAMDVYITGEGFIVSKDASGRISYSRLGNLGFDSAGNLVDGGGHLVQGFPIDSSGNPTISATGTIVADQLSSINVDPKILEKLTGISISSSGSIIGMLEGDPTVDPKSTNPAWINNNSMSIPTTSVYNGPVRFAMSGFTDKVSMERALGLSAGAITDIEMGTLALPAGSNYTVKVDKNGNVTVERPADPAADPPEELVSLTGALKNGKLVLANKKGDVALTISVDKTKHTQIPTTIPYTITQDTTTTPVVTINTGVIDSSDTNPGPPYVEFFINAAGDPDPDPDLAYVMPGPAGPGVDSSKPIFVSDGALPTPNYIPLVINGEEQFAAYTTTISAPAGYVEYYDDTGARVMEGGLPAYVKTTTTVTTTPLYDNLGNPRTDNSVPPKPLYAVETKVDGTDAPKTLVLELYYQMTTTDKGGNTIIKPDKPDQPKKFDPLTDISRTLQFGELSFEISSQPYNAGFNGIIATAGPGKETSFVIGNLVLAKFQNSSGLQQSGTSYFTETANSGTAEYVMPGLEGTGSLIAGSLEMSNVDVSKEFTDMITTQRGFQANSRIITVSDEMLQELVNLKR